MVIQEEMLIAILNGLFLLLLIRKHVEYQCIFIHLLCSDSNIGLISDLEDTQNQFNIYLIYKYVRQLHA